MHKEKFPFVHQEIFETKFSLDGGEIFFYSLFFSMLNCMSFERTRNEGRNPSKHLDCFLYTL